MISILLKKEFTLIRREPRFWIPFLFPPAILTIIQVISTPEPGSTHNAVRLMQEQIMLLFTGCLLSSMGLGLTADSFAGERERNTLELLLVSPLRLSEIFTAKLITAAVVPVFFSLLWQYIFFTNMSIQEYHFLFKSMVLSISFIALSNALSLLVSLHNKTVRAAAQTSMFLFLAMIFGVQFLSPWYIQTANSIWIVPTMSIAITIPLLLISFRFLQKRNI